MGAGVAFDINMKIYNVLLIGAGQLGSRHLQGLGKGKIGMAITIVEPNNNNLHLALKMFEDVHPLKNIQIHETIASTDDIPPQLFDLVIIATNVDVRAAITKRLVSKHLIRNIIFEKVAFQSEKQFEDIISLLKRKEIESWVNCPRRHFEGYTKLAAELNNKTSINFKLMGVNWGLACNSVHFLDLFSFFSHNSDLSITNVNLENEVYESKRKGFIEFFGSYEGSSENGSTFQLSCNHKHIGNAKMPTLIEIKYQNKRILIEEALNRILYYDINSQIPYKEEPVGIIYQSTLTKIQAEQILLEKYSLLPTLAESYKIHKPLFKMLKSHYENLRGHNIELLPIT